MSVGMPAADVRSNPFTPTSGVVPVCWPGREEMVRTLLEAMAIGQRHPAYSSLVFGKRGAGKTTLLKKLTESARDAGWVVNMVDALPASAGRSTSDAIVEESQRLMGLLREPGPHQRRAPVRPVQYHLFALSQAAVDANKLGALLLVDEFHKLTVADASRIASAIQNAKLADVEVGFVGAGLDIAEFTLLANQGFAFLARCARFRTEPLTTQDTRRALHEPLSADHIQIDGDLLDQAAEATGGHPFAIQSVGFHLWERSHTTRIVDAAALQAALRLMDTQVSGQHQRPAHRRSSGIVNRADKAGPVGNSQPSLFS